MYYVTYVCLFFRFFTSAESAKHGKDALAKELEEDLRTTSRCGIRDSGATRKSLLGRSSSSSLQK